MFEWLDNAIITRAEERRLVEAKAAAQAGTATREQLAAAARLLFRHRVWKSKQYLSAIQAPMAEQLDLWATGEAAQAVDAVINRPGVLENYWEWLKKGGLLAPVVQPALAWVGGLVFGVLALLFLVVVGYFAISSAAKPDPPPEPET